MRSDVREEWAKIAFDSDPQLLIGWREKEKKLAALQVALHRDVFEDLAEICRPTIQKLQNFKERKYENFAALDEDEYFWYGYDGLAKPAVGNTEQRGADTDDNISELVRLVRGVSGLDRAERDQLDGIQYSFYAICWIQNNSVIGFVSRKNPVSVLKPGYRYFQYGSVMTTTRRPDFALGEGSDLVLGVEGIAIFKEFAFDSLLADRDVAFDQVKTNVSKVVQTLTQSIPLTEDSREALYAEARRTRTSAKRLHLLSKRLQDISDILSPEILKVKLNEHGVDPALLLSDNKFSFKQSEVGLFFDMIEGRFYEDDLSAERRRADRFSTRS